uniref:Uncharacterized protein n=1 Tax=Arundo donax TaxID=35708 RepID=A0A0A9AA55_ARUDO
MSPTGSNNSDLGRTRACCQDLQSCHGFRFMLCGPSRREFNPHPPGRLAVCRMALSPSNRGLANGNGGSGKLSYWCHHATILLNLYKYLLQK